MYQNIHTNANQYIWPHLKPSEPILPSELCPPALSKAADFNNAYRTIH